MGLSPVHGCEAWGYRYGTDDLEFVEVSQPGPDGETVYVAGHSGAELSGRYPDGASLFLVALDAANGSERWQVGYGEADPSATYHRINDLAVHPDGHRIYSATSIETRAGEQKATVQARSEATGATLWTTTPTDQHSSYARAVAPTPDGDHLLAAGTVAQADGWHVWLAKLDASDGERVWISTSQETSSPRGFVRGGHLAIDADAQRVFVGSVPYVSGSWRTAASGFNLAKGDLLWERRTDTGDGAYLTSMALAPGGNTLVLAGSDRSPGPAGDWYGRIAALDAASGEERWKRILQPGLDTLLRERDATVHDVEVGPEGELVYATGTNDHTVNEEVYTMALRLEDGMTSWQEAHRGVQEEIGQSALEVAPDGEMVYTSSCLWAVSIVDDDLLTLARDAETGEERWRARYNSEDLSHCLDRPSGMAMGPGGERLFLAGWALNPGQLTALEGTNQMFTIAYELPPRPPVSSR